MVIEQWLIRDVCRLMGLCVVATGNVIASIVKYTVVETFVLVL